MRTESRDGELVIVLDFRDVLSDLRRHYRASKNNRRIDPEGREIRRDVRQGARLYARGYLH